jgi:hypothetical protein
MVSARSVVHSTQWRTRPACHGHPRVNGTDETESKGVLCTHILMATAGALLSDALKPDKQVACAIDKSS